MLLGHNVGRATVVNAAVYRSTLHFLLRALLLGPFTSWNRYKGRGGGGGGGVVNQALNGLITET